MTRDEILRRRLNLLRWLDDAMKQESEKDEAFDYLVEIRQVLCDIEHAMDNEEERDIERKGHGAVPQEAS